MAVATGAAARSSGSRGALEADLPSPPKLIAADESRDTPVAFFIFKRPELTAQVFARIRAWQPRRLLLVADGPRFPNEAGICARTRAIATAVDWPCRVETDFARSNLGCRTRISSGLDWVFRQVEEAVILEDDCLPHGDFLPFCASMLQAHRTDDRVMMVTGTNLAGCWQGEHQDFHYSLYGSIWGWATWRRAWQHYDVRASSWADERVRTAVCGMFPRDEARARRKVFKEAYERRSDTWDYQWTLARLIRSGLCVVPAQNLIQNIGFGAGATHTVRKPGFARLETAAHAPPYRSCPTLAADRRYDRFVFKRGGCGHGGWWGRRAASALARRTSLEAARLNNFFSREWRQL